MAVKWTRDQENVIKARGSNLLVSAAAGSGKTAVLVERIIRRILDEEDPIDIDRMLVVTFTRAAAAEMRERVTAAIEARCMEEPDNERLQRQQALVHNAQITTIDSFCAFVVRNHFGDIGIEPNFRVADPNELDLLRQDVVRDVFEACYREAAEAADRVDDTGDLADEAARTYPQVNPRDFLQLVDAYSGSRNDAAVKDMVLEICHMSESSPWPKEWAAGIARSYQAESAEEFEHTDLMQEIAAFARIQLLDARDRLAALLQRAQETEGLENYAATLEHDVQLLDAVCSNLTDKERVFALAGTIYVSYEKLYEALKDLNLGNMGRVVKFQGDAGVKKYILDERGRIKKEIEGLRDHYFSVPLEELYAQTQRIRPMAEQLAALSLRCLDAFAEVKRQRRMVSFADMEHFALNILVDEKTKELRPAAEEFQDRFLEIMVDEYQDSNQVQEEILTAISRESRGGHNRFMVGDIKQSIYRFRLARPEIFMEKYRTFETAEHSSDRRITLSRNFRSRPEVLDFVNDIFVKIMQPDLGSVAYDEEAMLYRGADYPESEGMEAEVLLYDTAEDSTEPADPAPEGSRQSADAVAESQYSADVTAYRKVSASEDQVQMYGTKGSNQQLIPEDESPARMEIHMIAQRIRQLHGSLMVKDKEGGLRPLRYADIAILMRGVRSGETDLIEIMSDAGIPIQLDSTTGYFSSQEVRVMLAFLQILDNPLQDIPLAAVLHSPIAGLSDEELAQIRIAEDAAANAVSNTISGTEAQNAVTDTTSGTATGKKPRPRSFAEAAWDYLEQAPSGSTGAQFYELYGKMRSLVQDTPIHELIQRILQETGYRDYVCMLPAGHKRAANLDMLVEKAADYEQTSYKGLFHFVRYIEKMHKYDVDFGEAQEGNVQEDAVSVMTIHKSKGLEFPVVFVAGTGRKLNQQDSRKKMLLHADLGIGLNEMQLAPKRKTECLIRQGIADRITRENLGEELRILYVAMTRAKEKLIVTGTVKDYDALIEKYTANVRPDHPLPFSERSRAGCYLDWILPAMQSWPGKYEANVYSGTDIRKEEERLARSEAAEAGNWYTSDEKTSGQNQLRDNRTAAETMRKIMPEAAAESTGRSGEDATGSSLTENAYAQNLLEQIQNVSEEKVGQIRQKLSYVYPYTHEAGRKSKYSVSELKHDSMLDRYDREQNEAEVPDFLKEEKEPYVPLFVRRRDRTDSSQESQISQHIVAAADNLQGTVPAAGMRSKADFDQLKMKSTPDSRQSVSDSGYPNSPAHQGVSQGALRGTAVHRVMECLDFHSILETAKQESKVPSAGLWLSAPEAYALARKELSRMQDTRLLSSEYAALVPVSMISAFLQNPVALRMAYADERGELFREKPFVMEKDGVLIQGIIDAFWMEEDRIVLLDYKTDAVRTADELIARYQTQLELYAEVLKRLFGGEESGKTVECMMYSHRLKCCVQVPAS